MTKKLPLEYFENIKRAEAEEQKRLNALDDEISELRAVKDTLVDCLASPELRAHCTCSRKRAFSYKGKEAFSIPAATLLKLVHLLESAKINTEDLKEHLIFKKAFSRAVQQYQTTKKRTEIKRTAFFRAMGITSVAVTGRGKRPAIIPKEDIFRNYAILVHHPVYGNKPLEPKDALRYLQKAYGLQSPEAVAQEMRKYLSEHKKELEALDPKFDPQKYEAWIKIFRIPRNP
jgi:hypothetical protein